MSEGPTTVEAEALDRIYKIAFAAADAEVSSAKKLSSMVSILGNAYANSLELGVKSGIIDLKMALEALEAHQGAIAKHLREISP